MIKVKWAKWKTKGNDDVLDKYDIVTIVLKQNKIYFDPTEDDFLNIIFKEYVRKFLRKKSINLKLTKKDIFFYAENSNVYLLNHIYNEFFPQKTKNPFNPILDIEDEGSINLHLFNGMDGQILFLIDILEKMNINFKKLYKKYTILSFPQSLECYDEKKIYNMRYEKWKCREKKR